MSRIDKFFCKLKLMHNGHENDEECGTCAHAACISHKTKQKLITKGLQLSRPIFYFGFSIYSSESLLPTEIVAELSPHSSYSWVYLVLHFVHHAENVIPDFDRTYPPLIISGANQSLSQHKFCSIAKNTIFHKLVVLAATFLPGKVSEDLCREIWKRNSNFLCFVITKITSHPSSVFFRSKLL